MYNPWSQRGYQYPQQTMYGYNQQQNQPSYGNNYPPAPVYPQSYQPPQQHTPRSQDTTYPQQQLANQYQYQQQNSQPQQQSYANYRNMNWTGHQMGTYSITPQFI